ncbi:hypothetical protein L249_5388, partial [Ophiocordyceps polyrhachis-furcata BCC 54312]
TRPEGLGGSRDAGSATADPRPPYHNNVGGGYGYGTATPYSGYGRTGRTGPYSDDRIRLEKHAFFYRKVGYSPGPGPGPGPDKSIEHSYRGGYSYGTATLYSGYGRTGRTGYTGEGT